MKSTINICLLLIITVHIAYTMDRPVQPNVYITTSSDNVITVPGRIIALFPTLTEALNDGVGTQNVPMPLLHFDESVIISVMRLAQIYVDDPQLVIDLVNQFSNDDLNNIIALLNYLDDTNIIAIIDKQNKQNVPHIISDVHVSINKKTFTLNPKIVSYMKTVQDAVDVINSEKVIELAIDNNNVEELFAFIIDLIKQYDVSPQDGKTIQDMMMKKSIPYLVQLY